MYVCISVIYLFDGTFLQIRLANLPESSECLYCTEVKSKMFYIQFNKRVNLFKNDLLKRLFKVEV